MGSPMASSASASNTNLAPDPLTRPSDKRAIQAHLWALKPLTNLRGSIPLPYVTTFLMVALDEGKGVGEYARDVGIHRAAMSRYLRCIGGRARYGGPGLGLVTIEPRPGHGHPNSRQVLLTAKGRSLAKEIFKQMRKAGSGNH